MLINSNKSFPINSPTTSSILFARLGSMLGQKDPSESHYCSVVNQDLTTLYRYLRPILRYHLITVLVAEFSVCIFQIHPKMLPQLPFLITQRLLPPYNLQIRMGHQTRCPTHSSRVTVSLSFRLPLSKRRKGKGF